MELLRLLFIIITFLLVVCVNTQLFANKQYRSICPHIYQKTFTGFVPRGNLSAGIFTEDEGATDKKSCILGCCLKEQCNVAFMTDDKCYYIKCFSSELCVPMRNSNPDSRQISMVLVKPVTGQETWAAVLMEQEMQNRNAGLVGGYDLPSDVPLDDNYKDFLQQMDESTYSYVTSCDVGVSDVCGINEECVQNHPKSRAGTCKCKIGFVRNQDGDCGSESATDEYTEKIFNLSNTTLAAVTKKRISISAQSKEVKLPTSEVSLTVTVNPPPREGVEKYQYDWTSLHQPEGSSAVKHQNGETLQLSNLSEGLYTFKVSVSSEDAYGETFVNVTVLPPSRINQPPKVIITPANQTIKLPNTGAVLDASSSTDDDGIVSWHWELQQGPLGYQPQLQETPTLQLNDLSKPGNYTFKLTVTDTDKATNSSIANITVLKITDYPPEANAGQDTIIYLPHNQLILNGNLSTDDHLITTWEWTKSSDDAEKAVDMQDTRTPYLRLSDLEEGMYTFTLKVTDSANQSSTAQVHVFVKPPTNQPPIAKAGPNITINLPQTWVVVDASNSTDDNKIVGFKWDQVEGPSSVAFVNPNTSKTNVTGLTKGKYVFKVTVTDDNNNTASDAVYITVDQSKNQKPVANAGGDFEIELPRNVIFINGSKSSDDWAIVKWKWTRNDKSLALGNIAEKSDEAPVLMMTDATAGKYVFNLTVFDEQGLSDTDMVTVTVKNDPKLYYLIDMIVDTNVNLLTEAQYNILKGKLALLVQDGTKLQVRSVRPQVGTDRPIITFYVETPDGKPLLANDVVAHLRQKLKIDGSLLGFFLAKLQTTICQNNCSGHGVCNEQTRKCTCEAFWMEDMFKVYLDSGEDSDCSWSILYVVLGVICFVFAVMGTLWGLIYLCINGCSKRGLNGKPTTYKLLEDTDELPPYSGRKPDLSDSDTDSDVVFESRNKSSTRFNGADVRNGHKSMRNGFTKMGRRIKT